MANAKDIETIREYEEQLGRAITDMKKVLEQYPTERGFQSILLQLESLRTWTKDREPPTPEQKGRLNFGLIASKVLDDTDQDLAQRLYALSGFILHWRNPES